MAIGDQAKAGNENPCSCARVSLALLPLVGLLIGCGGPAETTPADLTPTTPAKGSSSGSTPRSADSNLRLDAPAEGSTMDAQPNFGGIAGSASGDSEEVTIKVWNGGDTSGAPVETVTTRRRSGGTFSKVIGSPLASGEYTARAEQVDSDAKVGQSEARRFTVDTGIGATVLAAGDIAGCDTSGDEATAALLDRLPGTVLALGDLAYEYGTPAQYECYDATWGRHKDRTRPTPGDHDYERPGAQTYFDYFGSAAGDPEEGYYSYDLGDWHIVSLNSNCGQVGGCGPSSAELPWLRADLAANPAACTLAYFPNSVFSSGAIHGNQSTPRPFWEELYAAGADVVLGGDDHVYERFAPQTPEGESDPATGIREFVVGTGGRSHYDFDTIQPNSEIRNNDTFGILKLTLMSDRYQWEFIAEEGKTFTDSGETQCH